MIKNHTLSRPPADLNKDSGRSDVLYLVKGFAIVGVLFAHMSYPSRLQEDTLLVIHWLQQIFGWCVLAFFFCAGVVAKKVDGFPALKAFMEGRFRRLIIPCLIFTLTYKVLLVVLGKEDLPYGVSGLFWFVFDPVGPQFYFLPYLYGISVLGALLWLGLGDLMFLAVSISLFFIGVGSMGLADVGYGKDIENVPIYFYSYFLGLMAKQYSGMRLFVMPMVLLPPLLVFLLSGAIVYLYILIPVLMYFLLDCCKSRDWFSVLALLGKRSGSIYVWHAPIVMPFVNTVGVKVLGGGLISIVPTLVVTLALCLALGWLADQFEGLRLWRF